MAEDRDVNKLQTCENVSVLSLSDEVLLMIFNFLRAEDRFILSNVCCRFDRILSDKTLCRNIDMSSKHDGSCLKYFGCYIRKRRHLISSINITNCDWISLPKMVLLTKNLSQLQILHVLNIYMPVKVLSKIVLESKQLRELSWSWGSSIYSKDETWSQEPYEVRSSLAGLKRLHISIADPSDFAVHEFLLYLCSGLTHLIIQVDLSLGQLPKSKLKGLTPTAEFPIIHANLKSMVLLVEDVEKIREELSITSLVVLVPANSDVCNIHPLNSFAPNLRRFALGLRSNSCGFNSWVVSALQTSDHLVELSLFGVHYCSTLNLLKNFWDAIKSLCSLKKLAVSPCVIPRVRQGKTSTPWDVSKFVVTYCGNTTEINKELAEMLQLSVLEEFEVGQFFTIRTTARDDFMLCEQGDWIPYVPVISIWTNLTCLAFDSIFSLAHLREFNLMAKACINLSSLRFRNIETRGFCSYVKNVANALPLCKALKHFRLDQCHISDYLKDLLIGLSHCSELEAIYITSNKEQIASHLKATEKLSEIMLKLINNCNGLRFFQVPLPNANMKTCNKVKNWLSQRLLPSRRVTVKMEFCSWLTSSGCMYHAFPPDGPHIEQMQWNARVAQTPLVL